MTKHIITSDLILLTLEESSGTRVLTMKRQDNPDTFSTVKKMLDEGRVDEARAELDLQEKVKTKTNGALSVDEKGKLVLTSDGTSFPEALGEKLHEFLGAGLDATCLMNFWERLRLNPDKHVRDQLFTHIKANNIFLQDDGRFIMYKRVNQNGTSFHDGKTEHAVGKYTKISRASCDRNPIETCGAGLHVAPWRYVRRVYSRGDGITLEMICDPAHAVSCPHKDCEKIRLCEYFVNRVMDEEMSPKLGIAEVAIKKDNAFTVERLQNMVKSNVTRKVRKQARKEIVRIAKRLMVDVQFTTDRITIPGSLMVPAGFRPGQQAVVLLTDRRSRFLYVTNDPRTESTAKGYNKDDNGFIKRVSEHTLKLTSTGALSIRNNLLAIARISSSSKKPGSYVARVVKPGLIEVRMK